jgi:hypothetical protein
MSIPLLNLVIYQGDTFNRSFQLMNSIQVERTLNAGDTRVYSSAVTAEIPANTELVFGAGGNSEVVVTTTVIAPVGASQILIAAHQGAALAAGAITETSPQDLTGAQCRGHIRQTANSTDILAVFGFDITPLSGLIRVSLSSTQTEALTANCEYEDLPLSEADLADPSKLKNYAWARGYVADFELSKNAIVQTIARARVWVPRGITR